MPDFIDLCQYLFYFYFGNTFLKLTGMRQTLRIIRFCCISFLFLSSNKVFAQASACPQVTIAPPPAICSGNCATLTANVQGSVATTSYAVSTIPYSPYSPTVGTPVLVNIDDVWTPVINLPFCFQFYGTSYTQFVIGSNGLISFNTAYAGAFCQWAISAGIPSTGNPVNSIMCPYHDIDPSIGATSDIRYQVYGSAPCREMVISWYHIPMYSVSCNSMLASQQIVLHETTNIIDMYITDKPLCTGWNGGAAIEGIQDVTGTLATVVPGRNFPTQWTATNDGKRFMPTGAPQYTLNWTGPSGSLGSANPITVCPATTSTYTCTVTNTTCAGPIVVTSTSTVTVTPGLTVTGSQTNSTSCTSCNGTATINVTVGTGPFTYVWTPAPPGGQGTPTATGLCPGVYSCTATNPGGCNGTQTFTITGPTAPTSTQAHTDLTCNGICNGTATIIPNPAGAYTYTWTPNVSSGSTASGLCAGVYVVTATNAGGCITTQTITVTQPPALTATQSQVNILCNGACNGSATVNPSGGTPPYSYLWSPTGGSGPVASPLCAGTYTCTITDANGCSIVVTFVITQPPLLTATSSSTPATCGAGNGTVTANPGGGTPGYSYSWNTAPVQTTQTATGLIAGTYICTITDLNGCTTTATATVIATGGITATITSSTNVSCFGGSNGSATAAPVGGTFPFTYSWTTTPVQNTSTAIGLIAGSYTCTVIDFNGCIATASIVITQPPVLTTTFSQVDDVCNGGTTGTATVNPSGGTPAYSYSWNTSPVQTTQTATGLAAGSYVCTITDFNGCIITQSVTITEPTLLTAGTSFVQSTCGNANGSATVNILGGTPSYGVSWNSVPVQTTTTATGLLAGPYTVTVTDFNGCTTTANVNVPDAGSPTASITATTNVSCFGGNNGSLTVTGNGGTPGYSYSWNTVPVQTTQTASGLTAGSYTVTLTDVNGCSTTASATVTEPPVLTISGSTTDVDCFNNTNGTGTVVVGGGTPVYTYSWNSAPVQTTSTASGLGAGSYTCTVTDFNGCIITQSVTITEPTLLTVASAGFNVSCFNSCDGQVVVIPNGGTPAYQFSWNTGCTSPSCNNICAGSYTVTVTDAHGCVATSSTTVTQPTAVTIVTSEIDAHCNLPDGSASAVGAGGTGALTYQWINGPSGANYNNIVPNTYSVIVTDANGCDDTAATTVNNLAGVSATLTSVTNLTCYQSNNGSVVTGASGGVTPYTYSWSAPAVSVTGTANALPAGNYSLIVTDSSGCTSTVNATVTEPPVVTIVASANPPAVCNGAGVQLTSNGGGGTPGYSYAWAPGPLIGNTQNIIPAATTTYTAYVVDINGCSDSTTVLVTVNPVPVAGISGDILSGCAPWCVNFADLSTVAPPGSINSWSWNFGDNSPADTAHTPNHCFANAGTYNVTLDIVTTDGCVATITMPSYITVFANPIAAFSAFPQPTTILNPVVTFTDSSQNASSWHWSFGDISNATSVLQNPSFTFPDPTCYDVVLAVASNDGCVDTTTEQICIDPDASIFVPNAFTPNDDGTNDFFFPQGVGIDPDHFEMWIFDRWGNMIYYTDDMSKGWDGRVQGHSDIEQIDTYIWKIHALDILGNKHNIEGIVNLIK
jgi:gliding motility-associated-like protein